MTNHSETTGSSENGDITGRDGQGGPNGHDGSTGWGAWGGLDGGDGGRGGGSHEGLAANTEHPACVSSTIYGGNAEYGASPADHQITLRTPAELADALPYLLGYRPEDSIVLVALHDRGGRGRFGGRARLGIPANPDDWGAVAQQLTQGFVKGSERRGTRPAQMVAYLCQEPGGGETGHQVMERLQPLAHRLRIECGRLDVPVIEALCISDGRFWSYCCGGKGCCPVEGVPMGLPGTSVLAAAATYAGIQVRGTLRELRARLLPLETSAALEQETALDTTGMALVPRILDERSRSAVAEETLELARRLVRRFAEAPVVPGVLAADRRDDELLGFDEAAALILGLQDRVTRDRAAERMEGDEAAPTLRLWRALARRCVGPYGEHAAPLLTLAGWVAWSSGDGLEAREALAMALGADPDYLFARLLHQACNEGLDPEAVRRCLRAESQGREPGPAPERPTDLHRPETGTRSGAGGSPGAGNSSSESNDVDCPGGTEAVERVGEVENMTRVGEAEGVESGGEAEGVDRADALTGTTGSVPHTPVTGASGLVPTPTPRAARRRRRVRPADAGAEHSQPASGAGEGREAECRVRGANDLRARTPKSPGTRPAERSRGGSCTRPAGKSSTRRRGDCPEGLRSDSDDTTGKG